MVRHSLMAKVAEKAAVQDQQRREKGSVGPQKLATDHELLVEAHEQGEKNKAGEKNKTQQKSAGQKTLERLRPPNSLFYKLYPQDEKDDATEKARAYWAKVQGDVDGKDGDGEGGLPSDETMNGAFTALKFLHGDPGAASASAPPPAPAAAAAAGAGDAEALKRKLLEALDPEAAAAGATSAQGLREGVMVEIFGLKGAPELNGKSGKLQSLDPASGRWQVDIVGAGPKKLKPDNLRVAQADAKRARTDAGDGGGDTTFL